MFLCGFILEVNCVFYWQLDIDLMVIYWWKQTKEQLKNNLVLSVVYNWISMISYFSHFPMILRS